MPGQPPSVFGKPPVLPPTPKIRLAPKPPAPAPIPFNPGPDFTGIVEPGPSVTHGFPTQAAGAGAGAKPINMRSNIASKPIRPMNSQGRPAPQVNPIPVDTGVGPLPPMDPRLGIRPHAPVGPVTPTNSFPPRGVAPQVTAPRPLAVPSVGPNAGATMSSILRRPATTPPNAFHPSAPFEVPAPAPTFRPGAAGSGIAGGQPAGPTLPPTATTGIGDNAYGALRGNISGGNASGAPGGRAPGIPARSPAPASAPPTFRPGAAGSGIATGTPAAPTQPAGASGWPTDNPTWRNRQPQIPPATAAPGPDPILEQGKLQSVLRQRTANRAAEFAGVKTPPAAAPTAPPGTPAPGAPPRPSLGSRVGGAARRVGGSLITPAAVLEAVANPIGTAEAFHHPIEAIQGLGTAARDAAGMLSDGRALEGFKNVLNGDTNTAANVVRNLPVAGAAWRIGESIPTTVNSIASGNFGTDFTNGLRRVGSAIWNGRDPVQPQAPAPTVPQTQPTPGVDENVVRIAPNQSAAELNKSYAEQGVGGANPEPGEPDPHTPQIGGMGGKIPLGALSALFMGQSGAPAGAGAAPATEAGDLPPAISDPPTVAPGQSAADVNKSLEATNAAVARRDAPQPQPQGAAQAGGAPAQAPDRVRAEMERQYHAAAADASRYGQGQWVYPPGTGTEAVWQPNDAHQRMESIASQISHYDQGRAAVAANRPGSAEINDLVGSPGYEGWLISRGVDPVAAKEAATRGAAAKAQAGAPASQPAPVNQANFGEQIANNAYAEGLRPFLDESHPGYAANAHLPITDILDRVSQHPGAMDPNSQIHQLVRQGLLNRYGGADKFSNEVRNLGPAIDPSTGGFNAIFGKNSLLGTTLNRGTGWIGDLMTPLTGDVAGHTNWYTNHANRVKYGKMASQLGLYDEQGL